MPIRIERPAFASRRKAMRVRDCAAFFMEFLSNPAGIGAVVPSSRNLARKMIEWIDWTQVRAVVECGAGTGVFTGYILDHMKPNTRFFAIELNASMAGVFSEHYPTVTLYQGSVTNVRRLCDREGIESVDVIISGLPWASFARPDQEQCLEALASVLSPQGSFATFAYLHGLYLAGGRRFGRMLSTHFEKVERSTISWHNLPPAVVYRCWRSSGG